MKKGFNNSIQKAIKEKQDRVSVIQNELVQLKEKAEDLRSQIQNYSDIDNIDQYSKLKSQLEVYENKIEVLARNLNSETSNTDTDQIKSIYDSFTEEVRGIDAEASEALLSKIKEMKVILEEAETSKNQIDILFDKWRDAFEVPTGFYSISPCHRSENYIVHHVRQLFDALKQRNILY